MQINEITMDDFVDGLQRTRTIVIPFGSVEEHGPHLPLGTDTFQPVHVANQLAQRRDLFVAPAVPYGVCRSSADHPGTVSVSASTLRSLAVDLVSDFYRQGLRCFVLLSGHAGGTHLSALVDAGEEMLGRFDDLELAVLNEFMLAGKRCASLIETPGDSHAGEIETSRLMHTHAALVKQEKIPEAEFPSFPDQGILVRDKRRYWPGGVWGDPRKASAEKGQQLTEQLVVALDELVDKLEAAAAGHRSV